MKLGHDCTSRFLEMQGWDAGGDEHSGEGALGMSPEGATETLEAHSSVTENIF